MSTSIAGEIRTLGRVLALLESLDVNARERVMTYLREKYPSKIKQYKATYRAQGKCADCAEQATHGARCAKHAEIHRRRGREGRKR